MIRTFVIAASTAALAACTATDGPTEIPGSRAPEVSLPEISTPTPSNTVPVLTERPLSGVHAWSNGFGLRYEGGWRDGEFHGDGTLEEPDGRRYSGAWVDGKRDGEGRQSHPNGTYYDGEWVLNQPFGAGTRKRLDGNRLSGQWRGARITNGLLTLWSGHTYAGPIQSDGRPGFSTRLIAWLEGLSRDGDAAAQSLLGRWLLSEAATATNRQTALSWVQRAAEQGDASAQLALAGELAPAERNAWLERAADQQHPTALHQLALAQLERGRCREAQQTFEAAIRQGSIESRLALARHLATTTAGCGADPARAVSLARDIAITTGQWHYLDTLAAGYARQKAFGQAIDAATAALARATAAGVDPQRLEELQRRVSLYEQQQPYVDPAQEYP